MEVHFKKRDHSEALQPPEAVVITVDRYSWNAIGGPERAYLKASAPADKWDLMDLLRAPVEIWDNGKCLWWGYVNKVTSPHGERQRIGMSLDEMYNYVIVSYAEGDTAAATDATSIAEYGQKETRINNLNAIQTEAQQLRGLYLADHLNAVREIEYTGGNDEINIECYGWYSTLGWKYYSTTDTSNIDNATQISTIVSGSGQFFISTIIEQVAGITSNNYRDGRSTALTYVNELLAAGTSNVRPMLAYVDRQRVLHVYERTAEPPVNKPDYLLDGNGQLLKPTGDKVPANECKVAIWVKPKDVPGALSGFSTMGSIFIQSAEYNHARKETTYRFANAYEQIRLAKYIADVVSGNSSGSSSPSSYYPYYIPIEEHTHIIRALHRTGNYASDISASSGQHITINTTPSASVSMTYNGLNYFTPGTDPSGHAGWLVILTGIYWINIYMDFDSGSTPPTAGDYQLRAQKRRTNGTHGTLGAQGGTVSASGWSAYSSHRELTLKRKLQAGEYLEVWAYNFTDGDIRVNNVEMVVSVERITG